MKEVCVEKRIEEVANTKIGGKYNLVQYKKEKEKMMIHKSVCQAVLAFRDKNVHMPMYAILSCGISAGAFKNEEFEKGYKHFDAEKAKTIFEMAKAYNVAMDGKGMPSDVLYRVAARYYKKVSHNLADLENTLSKAKKVKIDRKNFEELCKNVGA
jgi:predicted GH43/DUF377 family glycosyl hydrolase